MPRLRKTIRSQAPPNALMAGVVAATPPGIAAPIEVTLTAYGHRMRHEAFGWAPRGEDWPIAGDLIWVRRADDMELVVAAWHPSNTEIEGP